MRTPLHFSQSPLSPLAVAVAGLHFPNAAVLPIGPAASTAAVAAVEVAEAVILAAEAETDTETADARVVAASKAAAESPEKMRRFAAVVALATIYWQCRFQRVQTSGSHSVSVLCPHAQNFAAQ